MLNFFGPLCLFSYLGSVAFLELLNGHRFFGFGSGWVIKKFHLNYYRFTLL